MKNARYIAETDGDGLIAWVWRFGPNDRIAHPVNPSRYDPADLDGADFHGASQVAIREWLRRTWGRKAFGDPLETQKMCDPRSVPRSLPTSGPFQT
jgi:hypothetical protein